MANKDMVRRDPFDVFAPFFDFGRRWNDMVRGTRDEEGGRLIAPAMDVSESEGHYTIAVELPGLAKEDVKITIEKGVLTVSGEKKFEKEEQNKDYHCVERRYGTFFRSVSLPSQVDADKADARFENGVLTVDIPKMEQAKPKQLQIK